MAYELEQIISESDLIKERTLNDQYALELMSALTDNGFLKRSINPFAKKIVEKYSKRHAAAIVATLRNETKFNQWYQKELAIEFSQQLVDDFKKLGWTLIQNKV